MLWEIQSPTLILINETTRSDESERVPDARERRTRHGMRPRLVAQLVALAAIAGVSGACVQPVGIDDGTPGALDSTDLVGKLPPEGIFPTMIQVPARSNFQPASERPSMHAHAARGAGTQTMQLALRPCARVGGGQPSDCAERPPLRRDCPCVHLALRTHAHTRHDARDAWHNAWHRSSSRSSACTRLPYSFATSKWQ